MAEQQSIEGWNGSYGGSSLAFADLYRLHNEKGDKRIEIDSHTFPSSLTAPRAFSEVSWRSNRTIAAKRVTTLWSIVTGVEGYYGRKFALTNGDLIPFRLATLVAAS